MSYEKILNSVTAIRTSLMTAIHSAVEDYKVDISSHCVYVTDEEGCTREEVKDVDCNCVYLYDNTTLDLGDIGTDDLMSIYEAVRNEESERVLNTLTF